MATWQSRVEQLLYDGEEVHHQVGDDSVGVVVTSHRVMAFTPEADGANFRAVDRPNVVGVERTNTGEDRWLLSGTKWLLVGVFLAIGGFLFDFDGLFGDVEVSQEAGQIGLGGILGLFALLRTVFSLMDDALLLGGSLAALAGLGAIGWYLQSRAASIRIEVAGEDDIYLPTEGLTDTDVTELAEAIAPG